MDDTTAVNGLKIAIGNALAEANGRKGRVSFEDQTHAQEISDAVVRVIDARTS